jgi:hypothetical protein
LEVGCLTVDCHEFGGRLVLVNCSTEWGANP